MVVGTHGLPFVVPEDELTLLLQGSGIIERQLRELEVEGYPLLISFHAPPDASGRLLLRGEEEEVSFLFMKRLSVRTESHARWTSKAPLLAPRSPNKMISGQRCHRQRAKEGNNRKLFFVHNLPVFSLIYCFHTRK